MAKFLKGQGAESKAIVAAVAKDVLQVASQDKEESTKESNASHMRHLRKSAGHFLLLAPRLMNNQNLLNS